MTIRFSTVEELTRLQGIKILLYGAAKSGKTRSVATCPRPVIFSAERGLLSLRNDERTRNLPAAEINCIADLTEARNWALQSNEAKNYDTICLDSISEVAEVCLLEEKQKTLQSTPKGKKPNGFEPYAECNAYIMQILRDFRDMTQKHVLFICKQEFDKDHDTGITMYRPTMPGRELTKQIPYFLDEIFQCVVFPNPAGGVYNAYRTLGDTQNVAGDRSGKLDAWEQPHIGNIIQKILS